MSHLAMQNMAMAPKESETAITPTPAMAYPDESGPQYPYGLCLRLEADTLAKLGIDALPEVGDTIEFDAIAKVTAVSERADDHGGSYRCVELQIVAMGAEENEPDDMDADEGY